MVSDTSIEPLVTECPSCHTRFRVTPAQLDVADGRVRCGACLNVFHGREYLFIGESREQTEATDFLDEVLQDLDSETQPARADARDRESLGAADDAAVGVGVGAEAGTLSTSPATPDEADSQWREALAEEPLEFGAAIRAQGRADPRDDATAESSQDSGDTSSDSTPQRALEQDSPAAATAKPGSDAAEAMLSTPAADSPTADETPAPGSLAERLGHIAAEVADEAAETSEEPTEVFGEPAETAGQDSGGHETESAGDDVWLAEGIAAEDREDGIPAVDDDIANAAVNVDSEAHRSEDDAAMTASPESAELLVPAATEAAEVATAREELESPAEPSTVPSPGTEEITALGARAFDDFDLPEEPARAPAWQRIGMPVVLVLSALTLAAQMLYHRFDDWARQPSTRAIYQRLCPVLGCQLPVMIAVDEIVAKNLVVRTHPDVADALVVDALIVNQASFDQPFPTVELRFSDLDGELIAGRRFAPAEYLSGEVTRGSGMTPLTPVHIALEIVDPGSSAVNYVMLFR